MIGFVGVILLILENTFYQKLDENNMLHESIMLPIGAMCIAIAITIIILKLVVIAIKLIKN
jgi:hypothetical protein